MQSPRSPSSHPYLSVFVIDRVKLGNGVEAFRVISKYPGSEKYVIRRYSDFEWLRDRLFEKYEGVFIPPLRKKSPVEKFSVSAKFTEIMRAALEKFVCRIALHHELQQSEDLRTFLQADEETMERFRVQETGILKKEPADLMQSFSGVHSKLKDVYGKKPIEETTPEYLKLKRYILEIGNHLDEVQKYTYLLVKKDKELGQSLLDFGKAVKLLGACEGEPTGKSFSDLGTNSELLSINFQREGQQLRMNFEEHLKYYVHYVQSIKATIARRGTAFWKLCELKEITKLKEINLRKLIRRRSYKVGEAEIEYREIKAESKKASIRFEMIVKRMNEEIVRFQEQSTEEINVAFHQFAKGEADLANRIADAWITLLPKLEAFASV